MDIKKVITNFEQVEKVKVKSYSVDTTGKVITVVAIDGKEFLIFRNILTANNYAIHLSATSEDDPQFIKLLAMRKKSLEDYAKNLIVVYKAEHILSYNQKHKTQLLDGVIAYRVI
jgi:hypothetical protein